MSEDKEQTRLVDLALDVMEDELAAWKRFGTHQPKTTRIIRYGNPSPCPDPIGTEATSGETVQWLDVPDKDVNSILVRFAMDRVVAALRREFAI
ncbi:hypothetical protein [Bradyrhizobium sp. AZCC 1610]|uniref:hypothetical protein n=1 Tax=Bradyrhizobium sp. AZCC 1610 TaxID=3117020 RepID=UPI002FF076C0